MEILQEMTDWNAGDIDIVMGVSGSERKGSRTCLELKASTPEAMNSSVIRQTGAQVCTCRSAVEVDQNREGGAYRKISISQ